MKSGSRTTALRQRPCSSFELRKRIVIAAALLLTFGPTASSQQPPSFVIVANRANPVRTLTLPELRRIFMKQSRMWPHGEAVVPVDWDATSPIREEFSKRILSRSVREMAEFWVQQSITQGLAPPSTQRSARAILRFVEGVPGAISYLAPSEVDNTVRVIRVTGLK
jgi:ABC-type phosphate transport system substrate-binding protein